MIDKNKKPQADLEVKCPHCLSLLRVKFWKQRQDEPVEPDYDIAVDAEVLKQGKLFEQPTVKLKGKAKGEGSVQTATTG